MTDLVVSSRDALAQAIRVVDGKHDLGAAALADALLASGVVQVVPTGKFLASDPDHETVCGCGARGNGACVRPLPDEETVAQLVASESKLFEDAPREASTFCKAHLYGFEHGVRAVLTLLEGGSK